MRGKPMPDSRSSALTGYAPLQSYADHVNPFWFKLQKSLGDRSVDFIRGEGSWLVDQDNERWLDLAASYGASVFGHHYRPLVNALLGSIESARPAIAPFGISEAKGRLASELKQLAGLPSAHCQFFTTGAEAVEGAIKLARAFTGRSHVVTWNGSYHGMSLGSLPLTDLDPWKASQNRVGGSHPGVTSCGSAFEIIERVARQDCAAVLIEPIQGLGGGLHLSRDEAIRLRQACDASGTLLVFDEVLSGAGRTGRFLASQFLDWPVQPDLLLLSKALTGGLVPFSVLAGDHAIFEAFFGQPGWERLHGSTYSGNEHAVAVALESIEHIKAHLNGEKPGLRFFAEALQELTATEPGFVEARVYGGLIFLRFLNEYPDHAALDFFLTLYRMRVLVLPCGPGTGAVKLLPSLNISLADAEQAITAIRSALSTTTSAVQNEH